MSLGKPLYRLYTKLKLIALLRLGFIRDPYQPVPYTSNRSRRYRGTLERWNATLSVLDGSGSGSVLDVGCNTGFFSIEMAKRGNFSVGVDATGRQLMVANAIKDLYEVDGATFARMRIDPDNASSLPRFDMTSVFRSFIIGRYSTERLERSP